MCEQERKKRNCQVFASEEELGGANIKGLAKWSLDEGGEVEMKPTLSGFVSRIIFLIGTNVFQ